jgi:hypothetical protein
MPKKIIQDVIPPEQKRTIRNIPLPRERERVIIPPQNKEIVPPPKTTTKTQKIADTIPKKTESPVISNIETIKETQGEFGSTTIPAITEKGKVIFSRTKPFLLIGGIIFFSLIGYLIYLFFHVGATVVVVPKERVVAINNDFVGKRNPKDLEMPFEVITLEETGEKTVPATGEKTVEKRATGVVVIYNDYSSAPQRLIKNTRLLTDDGKIYRLESSVVVPGQKKVDGKTTPGSVEVSVVADQAGENYNIDLTDFTIPGFKEDKDPRYEKFYGRSKVPMTGGYKGTIKTASEADRNAAFNEVSASLKNKVISKAKEQVPKNFVLFDKAAYVSIETVSPPEGNTIKLKATLHGIIFDTSLLSKLIAEKTLPQYDGEDKVEVTDIEKLSFSPNSLEVAPWQTGNLPFLLVGTTTIRYVIDTDKLQKDLAGIPKDKKDEIFKMHPGIEEATPNLQPIWKSTFPEDPQKIKILIEPRNKTP